MNETEAEIYFPENSWNQVEARAEQVDQSSWVYVNTTIALGLDILDRYWENQSLGFQTLLLFEQSGDPKTYHASVVDFADLSRDPTNNETVVSVDVEPELLEHMTLYTSILNLTTTNLASWFFYIRTAIDKAEHEGRKVYINTDDQGNYRQVVFNDRVQA